MNSFVFNVFLNSARDVEEQTTSGKLFQTEVTAAEVWITSVRDGQQCDFRFDLFFSFSFPVIFSF